MRALETLILALIVVIGILGSTNARQSILDAYGSASFYAKLLDPENYENLREDCGENGGPGAYNNLTQSLQRFNDDITTFVGHVSNDVKLGRSDLRVGKSLFHDDCYEVPIVQASFRRATESLQACVKPEMRERVLIDSRVINSFLEYICGSSGHDFARFVYADGLQCLASNQRGLLHCAKQSFDHYLPGAEFVGDGISELKGAEILLHLNSKRCADVAQFRNCSIELLKKCGDRMSDGVFENIIWVFIRPSTTFCVGSFDDKPTRTLAVEEMSTIDGNAVGVPTEDDFVEFLSDRCEKNGGKSAFVALQESWKLFVDGFSLLADMSWDGTEEFHAVLQTYCRRGVILNAFEKYLTDTFKSCLAPEEQKTADIIHRIASKWLTKLCDNEEKGIAEFFAASGPECLASKVDDLQYCANQTLSISRDDIDWTRPLVMDAEVCTDFRQLRYCTVGALMDCEDKTPAYLVDSVFGIIHNEMSCRY